MSLLLDAYFVFVNKINQISLFYGHLPVEGLNKGLIPHYKLVHPRLHFNANANSTPPAPVEFNSGLILMKFQTNVKSDMNSSSINCNTFASTSVSLKYMFVLLEVYLYLSDIYISVVELIIFAPCGPREALLLDKAHNGKQKNSLVDNSIHFSAWALGIVQVKNVPNILRSSEKQRVWSTQSDKKVDG